MPAFLMVQRKKNFVNSRGILRIEYNLGCQYLLLPMKESFPIWYMKTK